MKKILAILSKKIIFIPLIIVGVAAIGIVYNASQSNGKETLTVTRGDIITEVTTTGKTKPTDNVNLGFDSVGRIAMVRVTVGTHVAAGQTLATLDQAGLSASLTEAQARVRAAEAKLAQIKRGTRPEEIAISETKVEAAKSAKEDAAKGLTDAIRDAFTKSDDAIRARLDQFISNPKSSDPQLTFSTDPAYDLAIRKGRIAIEKTLIAWKNHIDTLTPNTTDFSSYVSEANSAIHQIRALLDSAATALSTLTPTTTITSATIQQYKTDITTARANIETTVANVSAADEKYRTAITSLKTAESELALDKAGSTAEDIGVQEAAVAEARASLAKVEADLSHTLIRAPFAGVITKVDAKVGSIATTQGGVITMNSDLPLEIEANIPEIEIGRIAKDNPVAITLDAFAGETFSGKVVAIDPAETLLDGVVNFKVTIAFDNADERLKSGLTANLKIQTGRANGVLTLPFYAITEEVSGATVEKMINDKAVKTTIVTGRRSSDGRVEITSGLSEGDIVLAEPSK
jgi:HlyD family secretion protein